MTPILIVNYGEDFSGSITPHFVPAGKNASVYRTDTAERTEAQIENGAVSLDIPSGKSVIIEY